MTVSNLTIVPHEKHENWYRLKFTSRKDSIGETYVEMLASEETLRWIVYQADIALKQRAAKDGK